MVNLCSRISAGLDLVINSSGLPRTNSEILQGNVASHNHNWLTITCLSFGLLIVCPFT